MFAAAAARFAVAAGRTGARADARRPAPAEPAPGAEPRPRPASAAPPRHPRPPPAPPLPPVVASQSRRPPVNSVSVHVRYAYRVGDEATAWARGRPVAGRRVRAPAGARSPAASSSGVASTSSTTDSRRTSVATDRADMTARTIVAADAVADQLRADGDGRLALRRHAPVRRRRRRRRDRLLRQPGPARRAASTAVAAARARRLRLRLRHRRPDRRHPARRLQPQPSTATHAPSTPRGTRYPLFGDIFDAGVGFLLRF